MLAQAIARKRAARPARRLKNRSKPMAEPATPAKSGKKLADSAVKLEVSTGRIEDSADRRTELAADRTLFAAERTYNACPHRTVGVGERHRSEGLAHRPGAGLADPRQRQRAGALLDVLFRRRGLASAQSRSAAADPDFAADIARAAGHD